MPDAKLYLEDSKETCEDAFPFLRLPAGIRMIIYEMALAFPRSGLSLERTKLLAVTRDFGTPFSCTLWEGYWNGGQDRRDRVLHNRPIGDVLALLRVNKQFYQEAVASFYSINTFVCSGVAQLRTILKRVGVRRAYITHITFRYERDESGRAEEAFRLLASLKRLRRLNIKMNERQWSTVLRPKGNGCRGRDADLLKIPGIQVLCGIRGIAEVVFEGECARIAAFLKPEMEKPRKAGQKRKASNLVPRSQSARVAMAKFAKARNIDSSFWRWKMVQRWVRRLNLNVTS